jgi:hypothetical protein
MMWRLDNMNTVNPDNFNETMQGYINYMIDFIQPRLKEEGYSIDDINRITQLIGNGLMWSKDDMTMEDARRYKKK